MSGRIFVFGSNLLGIHGAGAARFAAEQRYAEAGVGEGLTGQSYALPTCSRPGVPLPLEAVERAVARLLVCARRHPELTFQVTRVGCGHAGFSDAEIAPFFRDAPGNCELPVAGEWGAPFSWRQGV